MSDFPYMKELEQLDPDHILGWPPLLRYLYTKHVLKDEWTAWWDCYHAMRRLDE